MITRRNFIAVLACGLVTLGRTARAQQTKRIRRIGILTGGTPPKPPLLLATSLREYGWIEGENLHIESRGAEGSAARAASLAQELVQLDVEVLVTFGAVAGRAVKDATTTIPIVMSVGDPVRLGWVASLSHPGGNITGYSTIAPELAVKRLEILHELLPEATRIGELVDPGNEYLQLVRKEYETAFRSMGMQPVFIEITNPETLDQTLAELTRQRVDALIVRGDPIIFSHRDQIMDFALKHALPTMAEGRQFLSTTGFVSYGPTQVGMFNQMASLVAKILRGAKPGDLPFEQPSKIELVINLKTAKALGITIPQSLLLRADEVIQ